MSAHETITVPDIGDFTDVDVIEVHIQPGDVITPEQSLITLETDKATLDVPSPMHGTIVEVCVKEGDKVSLGSRVATVRTDEAEATATPEKPADAASQVIPVPDIGDFKDVPIIDIHVAVGDEVDVDTGLVTLETEKATMEVPSPQAGKVIEVLVSLNQTVSKDTPLIVLAAADASVATSAPAPTAPPPTPEADVPRDVTFYKDAPYQDNAGVHAGPATRRLARDLNVSLQQVTGTGIKGRITTSDLHQFVKAQMHAPAKGALPFDPLPEIDFSQFGEISTTPLSRINKRSAQNLHRNWVQIPHVTQFDAADITELEAFRQENKHTAMENGIRLTMLVFLMKAVSAALREFPKFNTSLSTDGASLIQKHYTHIGIAVDTPNGLVVPVVRNVDMKSVYQLADELGSLSEKARAGTLSPQEMKGSCFTISSLGGIGGTAFTPIINAPDVAILGVSRASMQPVYHSGEFVPRLMLPLSLSYDHRVIDGADAARFTTYMVDILSNTKKLLLM